MTSEYDSQPTLFPLVAMTNHTTKPHTVRPFFYILYRRAQKESWNSLVSGIRSVISKLTIKTVVDTATGLMSLNIVRGRGIAANEFINFAGKERER
jgi:hypothetical protein